MITEKLSQTRISDYKPKEDANVVPFIRGEVIRDHVEPVKSHYHISEAQKVFIALVTVFLIVAIPLMLLPWMFKFVEIVIVYTAIAIVSKGDFSTPSRGSDAHSRSPGKAIVPRS